MIHRGFDKQSLAYASVCRHRVIDVAPRLTAIQKVLNDQLESNKYVDRGVTVANR